MSVEECRDDLPARNSEYRGHGSLRVQMQMQSASAKKHRLGPSLHWHMAQVVEELERRVVTILPLPT